MEYQKSSNLDPNARLEISRIFVEGFYEWFKYFSKDKNKLTAAFSDAFVWEKFYVAMENGKIIGIAALTNGIETVVITNKKTLRKHLGFMLTLQKCKLLMFTWNRKELMMLLLSYRL